MPLLYSSLPRAAIIATMVTTLLLGACTPLPVAPPPSAPASVPASAPAVAPAALDAWYLDAARAGQTVLRIVPEASLLTIVVHRGGTLARLGHDHVVASRTIEGFVAPQQQRADFHFRLDQMSVDEPGLRKAAGFDTQPSTDAIAGTRTNMLTRVLDAEHYPQVSVRVTRSGDVVSAAIMLHGVTRTMQIPVRIRDYGAGRLMVSGTASLKQTDFGLVPFAVLGGAIAVEDQLDLDFTLVAEKL